MIRGDDDFCIPGADRLLSAIMLAEPLKGLCYIFQPYFLKELLRRDVNETRISQNRISKFSRGRKTFTFQVDNAFVQPYVSWRSSGPEFCFIWPWKRTMIILGVVLVRSLACV